VRVRPLTLKILKFPKFLKIPSPKVANFADIPRRRGERDASGR
jgi:hypothetical protein